MSKTKVILIDDESDARFLLRKMLESHYPDTIEIIAEADGVETGLKCLRENEVDLVFLDVQMRDGNGFDLLQKLEHVNFEVIFVTAYDKFAVKAFEFSAFGYLMKPIRTSELQRLVETFQKRQVQADGNDKRIKVLIENYGDERKIMKLVISNMEGFKVMEIENIIRLEGDGNYTRFIMSNNLKETASKNLGVYEDLLNDYGFFRSHQSTLINLRHVTGFLKNNDMIEMSDGEKVKLSRYRKTDFVKRFV
jgi:two-component system, LytTR family, response regulator